MHKGLFVLTLVGAVFAAGCVSGAKKIEEVKAGRLQEAKASWWGFDKHDSTKCLQAALDSGVKKLMVDNVGADWVVGPIRMTSNVEVVFADGVVVRAKKGDFKKKTATLFEINGQSNVTLRGEGNVLFVMNKADYMNKDIYEKGEHRHAVQIYNSQNVVVKNLTLKSSGGDGVYVGHAGGDKVSRNITLEGLICEDHHRQGISVISAENLLVKDCKFNDTKGTAPQCGVDFEPNYPKNSLVNVVMENCDFDGNAARGIAISCVHLNATSKPVSITFKNCRIRGNQAGVLFVSTGAGTPAGAGKIEFIDCEIKDNADYSLIIAEHQVTNMDLIFRNCVIDNRKAKTEAMKISSGRTANICGLRIEGLTVIDDATNRPPIKFVSRFSNGLADAVVTNVVVRNSAGKETAFDCAAFVKNSAPLPPDKVFKTIAPDLKTLRPVAEKGKAAGGEIRFREQTDYLQWAKAGDKIQIKFTNKPVHRFERKTYRAPLEVVVWSPSVTDIDKFGIPFDGFTNYTFEAHETGIYRFAVDARMQTACFETDAAGQAISAAETLYIFGCSGRLYFNVPAGLRDIKIEVGGAASENSSVFLLDPEGRQKDAGEKLAGSKVLQYSRPDVSKDEVWSIKFTAAKLFIRMGAPLVPVFATDPANLLVAVPGK